MMYIRLKGLCTLLTGWQSGSLCLGIPEFHAAYLRYDFDSIICGVVRHYEGKITDCCQRWHWAVWCVMYCSMPKSFPSCIFKSARDNCDVPPPRSLVVWQQISPTIVDLVQASYSFQVLPNHMCS
ncbi:hypothetical protein F4781DRAFT_7996 [Annulohypoxylon bovei var. microspora]|nr:hypothetical protein F4781DRAFT_7996 [Annulohypoxylon bovei var. microspora]